MDNNEKYRVPTTIDDENFLDNLTSNFYDFIYNNTRKLQKYFDAMYLAVRDIYCINTTDIKKKHKSLETICNFVLSENETIIKHESIAFINEFLELLCARYDSMTKTLATCPDDMHFNFSTQAFLELDELMGDISRKNIEHIRYMQKPYRLEKFINFEEYMRTEFESQELYSYQMDATKLTKNEIGAILDGGFMSLCNALMNLQNIASIITADMFVIIKCCRETLRIVISLYTVFSLISIYEE